MKSQVQIGKSLKKARKSLGLTQAQVAEKAEVSSNYYAMIDRGKKKIPDQML